MRLPSHSRDAAALSLTSQRRLASTMCAHGYACRRVEGRGEGADLAPCVSEHYATVPSHAKATRREAPKRGGAEARRLSSELLDALDDELRSLLLLVVAGVAHGGRVHLSNARDNKHEKE